MVDIIGGPDPAATAVSLGEVELATDAETVAGIVTDKVTTPANIAAKMAAPGDIGGTTPGLGTFTVVKGKADEVTLAASGNLTTVSGQIINNLGQANDAAIQLPAASEGANFTVCLGTTVAKYYRLVAGATDKIYLDGIAGANNGYVGVASAAAGNAISFIAFQTAAGVYDWYAASISGSWIAG